MASYFLTSIKPQTRAFSADVKAAIKVNGEEINSTELTYKEAEEIMKGDQDDEGGEAGEADAEDADADAESAGDINEGAAEAEETAEEGAEEAADGE